MILPLLVGRPSMGAFTENEDTPAHAARISTIGSFIMVGIEKVIFNDARGVASCEENKRDMD